MLDHVALNVRDLSAAKAYREQALAPLGYTVGMEVDKHIGFRSAEGELDFWPSQRGDLGRTHVAFCASDARASRPQPRAPVGHS
jgi:catechol 2,3-dioxygenase-like lactoylglutathione lyase family enzyme